MQIMLIGSKICKLDIYAQRDMSICKLGIQEGTGVLLVSIKVRFSGLRQWAEGTGLIYGNFYKNIIWMPGKIRFIYDNFK